VQHPFDALAPEYVSLLATATVIPSRAREIDEVAHKLLGFLPRYATVAQRTGVPEIWQATIFEREAGSNFHLYFGNGDPLSRVTTHVPAHRGPFLGPTAWEDGAIDALHVDRIETVANWDWPHFCYEGEIWNGLGPRNHGIHTGYLWGGMTPYKGGKYVRDGVWDPHYYDTQLGIVPVALRMIQINPALALKSNITIAPADTPAADHPAPMPPPPGVGTGPNLHEVQVWLNELHVRGTPIDVDGLYGRETRRAVANFQQTHHLVVDGVPGPMTFAAVRDAVAEAGL
jgi:lysozyme family protein